MTRADMKRRIDHAMSTILVVAVAMRDGDSEDLGHDAAALLDRAWDDLAEVGHALARESACEAKDGAA